MPELVLSQAEAEALIALEKHRVDEKEWVFPEVGGTISIPLVSKDGAERFILDVSRGRIRLTQAKYQNRARVSTVLLRLEIDGPRHQNPDGAWIECPHLHIYREGFGDKWATLLPKDEFPHPEDLWKTLTDFGQYCNITRPPNVTRGLPW